MSDLFCFGCNYSGETHDERCKHFVDVDRLTAERDALKARVAEWKQEVEDYKVTLAELEAQRGGLRAQVDRLRAALERYGRHGHKDDGDWCARHWVDEDCGEDGSACSCGLAALLA